MGFYLIFAPQSDPNIYRTFLTEYNPQHVETRMLEYLYTPDAEYSVEYRGVGYVLYIPLMSLK